MIELVKIVKCMEKTQLVARLIFHYVDPSHLRNQRGTFAESCAKHEEHLKDNIVNIQTWKAALTKVLISLDGI